MKLPCACARYALIFSILMAISALVLKHSALINHTNAPRAKKKILMQGKTIALQEFVFCNANELASFERKKKERAQHLIEQLCGITHVDTQRSRNLSAASRALIMNHGLSMHCNRQQFGIPNMRGNDSIGAYASNTCAFVKQIARKQISENNISQRPCRLSALEKLLK